jgi:integrase
VQVQVSIAGGRITDVRGADLPVRDRSRHGDQRLRRHYYATALISAGADPTDVQRALRHSSLPVTLETYVHWWPRKRGGAEGI